jgi:short-subunit dehydrogenase
LDWFVIINLSPVNGKTNLQRIGMVLEEVFRLSKDNYLKLSFMKKENLSIVITGASSGIGRATALEFARRGHKLALTARRKDVLEEVANECRRLGSEAIVHACDVTNEEEVQELARRTYEEFGSVDVWVNNAAVAMMGAFEETPMEDIKRLLDINVNGYFYGARAALRYFRAQGSGILVNVSSIVGLTGQPYSIAYTTSKAAIRGMTLCLQQEMALEEDIHVCMVLPATVDTPLFHTAANYMGRDVKAMEPVVDAQSVAESIVSLVKNPKQEVLVGGMAMQSTLLKYFSPDTFSKMYNKQVQSKHFSENRSEPQPGNLYEPSEKWSSIDGGWLNGQSSKAIKSTVKKTFWLGLLVAGVLAGSAAWYFKKNEKKFAL